jgi:O-acetyl-ADP-ribose deacetylase (regulator of RNase III)
MWTEHFADGMKTEIKIIRGDITKIPCDAMVNAANSALAGGGGVDGAIHRAGGPSIMKELDEIRKEKGSCPAGSAVVTGAGNLPARWVIHAVGPVWKGGSHNEKKILYSAYHYSLMLAKEKGARSISFPNISTGIFGYPKTEAVHVALSAVRDFMHQHQDAFERINFVCFDEENFLLYQKELKNYFPS